MHRLRVANATQNALHHVLRCGTMRLMDNQPGEFTSHIEKGVAMNISSPTTKTFAHEPEEEARTNA